MPSIEHFQRVERDFLPLAERAGLPPPDEINYSETGTGDSDGEVEFVWYEQKLAVVVELDEHLVAAVADDAPF